jgi:hypothetical protein
MRLDMFFLLLFFIAVSFIFYTLYRFKNMQNNGNNSLNSTINSTSDKYVHKVILANGLTVLVRPVHTVPKVLYNFGILLF